MTDVSKYKSLAVDHSCYDKLSILAGPNFGLIFKIVNKLQAEFPTCYHEN